MAKAPTKEEDLLAEQPFFSKCTLTADDLHKLKQCNEIMYMIK
jgi:hypothetical protein